MHHLIKINFFNNLLFILWRLYRAFLSPCTLEIHLADHCNLNCKCCNHYSPIAPINFPYYKEIVDNLKILEGLKLNFRLLGGEPLLNPEIEKYLIILRKYFKKSKIEIITNGILLQSNNLNKLSSTFLDTCKLYNICICITKYPIKIDYNSIEERLIAKKIKYRFFGDHTKKNGFHKFLLNGKKDNIIKNFKQCTEISCLQLVGDKIYGCPEAAYSHLLNSKFNANFIISENDYLKIKEVKNLRQIRNFRMRPKPFCGYCVFPRINTIWSFSKRGKKEWINIKN